MAFPWLWRQVESCISSCFIPSSSGTAKSLSVPSSNPVCGVLLSLCFEVAVSRLAFFFVLMHGNSFAQLAACPSILLQKELSKCFILQTWNILEFSLPMLACGRTCFGQRGFMETSQIWKKLSCEWIFIFFLIKTSERKGKAHKGAVCACEQLCCRHQ